MELKIGVIIIGSLIWDKSEKRISWRKELNLAEKVSLKLPIRYGRKSNENRQGTYTMVFSNSLNTPKLLGNGLVIPFKNKITSSQEFESQMLLLADAEGISTHGVFKSWGTVCISHNPNIQTEKLNFLTTLWNNLISKTVSNLRVNQLQPNIEMFGTLDETKSITPILTLNISLNDLFQNDLKSFDAIIATSNAVKLNDQGENKYPSIKQIAKAIYFSGYYDYFLQNRRYSITTFQDKMIARTLKRKYKVNLKKERSRLSESKA